ncbi:hexose transporter 2 [Lodderomyces elongisporus NRRL YB-4239]|uniref:Hexose transporter 2 n=1 Tax=Lodderomyces elongisporus (strain ATCC 11503 / CBS 2605 / JCM 1781 / NBRC 1676 / NRRL YB-4239) TaxID=379508 RepID=A5DUB5_LODEL|nr:hexose transporter 2 [Lodderomyces elongisporus NRRL YB-4239]
MTMDYKPTAQTVELTQQTTPSISEQLPKEDNDSSLMQKETQSVENTRKSKQYPQDQQDEPPLPEKNWKSYILITFLCFLVAFGGFVFGYDTGTISGFVNMTDFIDRFGQLDSMDGVKYLSNIRTGLIISIFNVGCCIGGLIFSKVGDLYGRRIGLMFSMAIYVVGIIVQITAQHQWYQICIGRAITGLAVGTVSVISPMFISESAPKKLRGTLVCCFQLCITLGIFIGYCCTYGTKQLNNSAQWRIPLGLCFLWAIFLIVGMLFMPESPRYLIEKHRLDDAKKSIAKSNKLTVDDKFVLSEFQLIQAGIDKERLAGTASWIDLITGRPAILKRVLTGIALASLQQLTGNNYFFYFATTIFKAVGLQDSFQTSMILGAVNFISTFVNIWAIERFGRRLCLLVGSAGMFVCFIIYSILGSINLYQDDTFSASATHLPTGKAMIFVTCLYIFFFASTWAGGVFAVLSEMYPLRVRSKAISVALGCNWMWGFLISFTSSFIINSIHFYYGFVFTGCIAVSFVFVYFCIMESKGLTLEEVDEMYAEGVVPWRSGSWTPPLSKDQVLRPNYAEFSKPTSEEYA